MKRQVLQGLFGWCTSAEEGEAGTPDREQMEDSKETGLDVTTQQDQAGPHSAQEVEGTEMETETQDEPQPSDQELCLSSPHFDQSSIKSEEARMVDISEVTSATEVLTLTTPRTEEASLHISKPSGTHAEFQK